MKSVALCLISLFFTAFSTAQELRRRPFLGIQMTRIDEDTRRVMQLDTEKGVLIKNVIAGSTAEKAGFKKGDILLKLNSVEINSPDEAVKYVASETGGASFSYELIRDKKPKKGKAVFEEMPREQHDGIEMLYTSVKTVNGLQRLIVSKPQDQKKHPVIVFIGGIGCYSLDFPLDKERSEVQLLNKLTRSGYVCVRAEKPGVGDNLKCTPCKVVSFEHEAQGYVSAVNAIKNYSYVDSTRIFIFGHSMGGVMGPIVARQTNIKGIIAYGTIGCSFPEYLPKTRRTIAEAYEMKPEEADEYIKVYSECAGYYFTDKLSTSEAAAKNNDCQEYLSVFDLRSSDYNQQLYALNIPGIWKTFKGKALLIYGESDYVASIEDHKILAQTVNFYHPGNAEFIAIKATSHGMTVAENFKAALKEENGKFNPEVAEVITNWLRKIG
jgi:pimeloyl-ACP methyl ester carboxylesterase